MIKSTRLKRRRYSRDYGIRRNYKDRLFKIIFGREENKELTLSLYNAVNGSDYKNAEDIKLTTIDNVIYMGMTNDVSFLVNGTINLYEHQSTINPNMPIRMLIYVGMLYSKYAENPRNNVNLYSKRKQKFPTPKLICFYNGTEEMPDHAILELSDVLEKPNESDIQVQVTVLNINHGHNKKLVESCKALGEYAQFIDKVRKEYEETGDLEESIEKALLELPKESIVRKIISENKGEVKMSILTEYDEERTMQMFKEEYLQEGRQETELKNAKAMLAKGISLDIIKEITGIDPEKLKDTREPNQATTVSEPVTTYND